MAPTARLPPKQDVALALLEQASMYIHLDPRADAVQVPAWFKKQPQLVLQVGLNMAVAIPDLHVDERGLSCTLSFNRTPFFCMIPWQAVFALVGEGGQAMVWAEDVPAEVSAQAQAQKQPPKPRPHLRSVGEGESAPPAEQPAVSSAGEAKAPAKKASAKSAKASDKQAVLPTIGRKGTKPKADAKLKAEAKPKAAGKSSKAGASKAAPVAAAPKAPAKKPAPAPQPAVKAEPAAVAQPAAAKKPLQPKAEAPRAATEISKPKRELPPYLRVVK